MKKTELPGGLLVAIEGIDGAGKTTLANGIQDYFRRCGIPVNASKEPTRGPWGMKLRESAATGRLTPEDEQRFLLLDRRQHVDEVIRPALRRSEIVILDRYYPSMVAYQGAAGLPVDQLLEANDFAPRPDVLLLLDIEPEQGLARIRARGDEPNHFETPENLTAAREIFLGMRVPGLKVVDASQTAEWVLADAMRQILLAVSGKLLQAHKGSLEAVDDLMDYFHAQAL